MKRGDVWVSKSNDKIGWVLESYAGDKLWNVLAVDIIEGRPTWSHIWDQATEESLQKHYTYFSNLEF